MLDKIFQMQRDLNIKIGRDTVSAPTEVKEKWLFGYAFAMNDEVQELLNCVDWKWWSKTVKADPSRQFNAILDKENAKIEAIDALHFLVSIFQILDMTPEDVAEIYRLKWEANIARQENGYDVRTKTEDDNNTIKQQIS